MKEVLIEGLRAWIWLIMGVILEGERPRRRMVEGEECARERATVAPIEFWLGPVMTTRNGC